MGPFLLRIRTTDGRTMDVPAIFWFPGDMLILPPRFAVHTRPARTPKALPGPGVTLDAWRTLNRMNAKLREQTLIRVSHVLLRSRPKLLA